MNERKKKLIKVSICILVLLGVLIIAVWLIQGWENSKTPIVYSYDPFEYKSEIGYSLPEENIYEDEEYMEENRFVKVNYLDLIDSYDRQTIGGATDSVQLLFEYINAAIEGRGDALNSMFTENYFENNGKPISKYPSKFSMQKIFDINITLVDGPYSSEYNGEEVYIERFEVSFLLKDNNGEFRPDLPEPDEGTIPLVFEVLTIEGESKINSIVKYSIEK